MCVVREIDRKIRYDRNGLFVEFKVNNNVNPLFVHRKKSFCVFTIKDAPCVGLLSILFISDSYTCHCMFFHIDSLTDFGESVIIA